MKLTIPILLALSGGLFAQTAAVTKNPNNNQITGNLVMGANRILTFDPNSLLSLNGLMRTTAGSGTNGQVQVNNSGITFGTVSGMLTVTGQNNHAVIARTQNPSDGIALVGWSSSGASAVKAVQDTYFSSPALTVWRDTTTATGSLSDSAGVLLTTSGTEAATTQSALEVRGQGTTNFKIAWNGEATSRGHRLTRWLGAGTVLPTADLMDGDMFLVTGTGKVHIRANGAWIALN